VKIRIQTVLTAILPFIVFEPAPLVNDEATNVLSNRANIKVGTNGDFTLLVLSNNTPTDNTQSPRAEPLVSFGSWCVGSKRPG
jgi:hypothetical protein